MKKVLLLFCAVLSSTWWVKAQQTALEFDGVDDFAQIEAPNVLVDESGFTVNVLLKMKHYTGNYQTLLLNGDEGDYLKLGLTPGGRIYAASQNGYAEDEEFEEIRENECTWVSFVFEAGQVSFYLNGQLGSQQPFHAPSGNLLSKWYVGADVSQTFNQLFAGLLDEISLWPYPMSSSQLIAIQQPLMLSGIAGSSVLFSNAHFKCNRSNYR